MSACVACRPDSAQAGKPAHTHPPCAPTARTARPRRFAAQRRQRRRQRRQRRRTSATSCRLCADASTARASFSATVARPGGLAAPPGQPLPPPLLLRALAGLLKLPEEAASNCSSTVSPQGSSEELIASSAQSSCCPGCTCCAGCAATCGRTSTVAPSGGGPATAPLQSRRCRALADPGDSSSPAASCCCCCCCCSCCRCCCSAPPGKTGGGGSLAPHAPCTAVPPGEDDSREAAWPAPAVAAGTEKALCRVPAAAAATGASAAAFPSIGPGGPATAVWLRACCSNDESESVLAAEAAADATPTVPASGSAALCSMRSTTVLTLV